ncbi:MAG: VWA domain-containing protein [Clostridia bacterium]|nr:VWA domain-containing protein [Clostridia bacterium]
MKKLLIIVLTICMVVVAGCATAKKPAAQNGNGTNTENGGNTVIDHTTKPGEYADGVIGENKSESSEHGDGIVPGSVYDKDGKIRYDSGYATEAMPAVDIDYGEYPVDVYVPEPVYPGGIEDGQITAGTLTAGEIKDLDDLAHWLTLWNEASWDNVKKARGLNVENVIAVKAAPMAEVKLIDGDNTLYTAVADIYGNAYLLYKAADNGKAAAVVSGSDRKELTLAPGAVVELTQAQAVSAAKLDLMLMIDTTGSMGDELEYIKVELKDVIERVRKEQNIDIRISVNFYRDEGDEYIVKYYDFRENIDDCVAILSEQYSNGGGDYPEAVHTAINNVLQHNWRQDAVKLCFFVLDAPPHSEDEIQSINAGMLKDVESMAAQGIRFISVVSSGADSDVEVLMRSFAVMTGGTYLFLTNDSGIGGDHQEPTDTQYEIEPLNDCMVRVIKDYVFAK